MEQHYIANINLALTNLQFVPVPGFDGAASLEIVTNDQGHTGSGGPLSDTDTINITVQDGAPGGILNSVQPFTTQLKVQVRLRLR